MDIDSYSHNHNSISDDYICKKERYFGVVPYVEDLALYYEGHYNANKMYGGTGDTLIKELKLGKPIEITACSLYGYQGELFENGRLIVENAKTNLPCLTSLTSDKFVKTTHLTTGTIVNMEDYTFMYLKKPQDFIIRIVSDFLPHATEIDFFKEIEQISFEEAIKAIEEANFQL